MRGAPAPFSEEEAMILSIVTAALLSATGTAGEIPADAIRVRHHPKSGNYCIRPTKYEGATRTGTAIHSYTCRSERTWRQRGVTFSRRPSAAALARL
jgi:hypothetical protein